MTTSAKSEDVLFDGRPTLLLLVGSLIKNGLLGGAAIFFHYNYTDRWLGKALAAIPEQLPNEVYRGAWWAVHGILGLIAFSCAWSLVFGSLRLLTTRYRITTRRIQEEWGIFSRTRDNLELIRVTDVQLRQPFLLRMFGCGDIVVTSADRSSPWKYLRGVPNADQLMEQLTEVVHPGTVHELK